MTKILDVKNLNVSFPTEDGLVRASNEITFSVSAGETLAIVGESGSGKSVSNLAVMGLHNPARTNIDGSAILTTENGPVDVITANPEAVRRLRGKTMSMIFQDPMSALHPFFSIGQQISEAWALYNDGSKEDGIKRAVEMLEMVGIPDPELRVNDYPHQFSGGMRQRAMIAMALVNNPSLLIADEPTTALDVTVQSQIMNLLKEIQKKNNMAIILITHDLGVVAEVADRICVMYAGRIVEEGTVDEIFYQPSHPYTLGLLNSIPKISGSSNHRLHAIPGQPPSLIQLPNGCSFKARCEYFGRVSGERCSKEVPEAHDLGKGHKVRCHLDSSDILNLVKDKA